MQIFWVFLTFSDSGMRFEVRIDGLFTAQVKHYWVTASAPHDGELWLYIAGASGVAYKFNLGIGKELRCIFG